MSEQEKDETKKGRYKRVPVYTKEHYGSPKPIVSKKVIDPFAMWILVLTGTIGMIISFTSMIGSSTRPKQAWEIEQEANEWYNKGSYNLCEEHLKEQLRDPKSYERAGEVRVIKNNGIEKGIAWEFRARNGFGGMNVGEGVCLIKKNKRWVAATIK